MIMIMSVETLVIYAKSRLVNHFGHILKLPYHKKHCLVSLGFPNGCTNTERSVGLVRSTGQ
jgi:hypothetical protein